MELLTFWFGGGLTLLSGLMTVTRRNAVASVMWLVMAFLGMSILFFGMSAEFVGVLQILVYAGAIMVLFLFVIMLLNLSPSGLTRIDRPRLKVLGLTASLAFVGVIVKVAVGSAEWTSMKTGNVPEMRALTIDLSDQLFNYHVLPFEVASVLLLVAIVGAVALTKKKL